MKKVKLKYTVIIPCFNAEKYIRKAINSVLSQSSDVEIIVVDDGSTDNTEMVVNQLNIKYIKKKNGGVSSARNVGIKNASGDYILFLDADDTYRNGLFSKLNKISSDNKFDFISFGFEMKYKTKKIKRISNKYSGINSANNFLINIFKKNIYQSVCSICFKRSILIENQIEFNEKYKYGEDYDFMIRAMLKSNMCFYINEIMFSYIIRDGSAMTASSLQSRLEVYELYSSISKSMKDKETLKCFNLFMSMYQINDIFISLKNKDKESFEYLNAMKYISNSCVSFSNKKTTVSTLVKIFRIPIMFSISKLL